MITSSNSLLRRSGTPTQYARCLLHTMAMSGLFHVRTELDPLPIIPSLAVRKAKSREDTLCSEARSALRFLSVLTDSVGNQAIALSVPLVPIWPIYEQESFLVRNSEMAFRNSVCAFLNRITSC